MTRQRRNSDQVLPDRVEVPRRGARHRRTASAEARIEPSQNPPPRKKQQGLSHRVEQQKHSSNAEAFPGMTAEEWKKFVQNVNAAEILGIFKEFLVAEDYETETSVNAVDALLTKKFIQRLQEVLFLSCRLLT